MVGVRALSRKDCRVLSVILVGLRNEASRLGLRLKSRPRLILSPYSSPLLIVHVYAESTVINFFCAVGYRLRAIHRSYSTHANMLEGHPRTDTVATMQGIGHMQAATYPAGGTSKRALAARRLSLAFSPVSETCLFSLHLSLQSKSP